MDESRVIAEVARRNGVLLAPNDPIMQISTMLDLHARDHHERLAAMEERDVDLLAGLSRVLDRAEKHAGGALAATAAADLPKAIDRLVRARHKQERIRTWAWGFAAACVLAGLGAYIGRECYRWGNDEGAERAVYLEGALNKELSRDEAHDWLVLVQNNDVRAAHNECEPDPQAGGRLRCVFTLWGGPAPAPAERPTQPPAPAPQPAKQIQGKR